MLSLIPIIFAMFTGNVKEVNVIEKEFTSNYATTEITVQEFLADAEIILDAKDKINVGLNEYVTDDMKIFIERAIEIEVVIDGEVKTYTTTKNTVKEALVENNIYLNPKDHMNYKLDDLIEKDMKITVDKYSEKIVTLKESIPYEKQVVKAMYLEEGVTKVGREGKEGIKEKEVKITYIGGKEVNRESLKEIVVEKPEVHIVLSGAVKAFKADDGKEYKYTKKLDNMSATSYTDSIRDTGKDASHPEFGITFTGTRTRKGVVAVDPKVIPLGTKLYVEGYGEAIAEDTGSAIKGYTIDLYVYTQEESDRFGRQARDVYILAE